MLDWLDSSMAEEERLEAGALSARRDDDDLEGVGRDALLVAQARCAQGCIHAGKAGTDDQDALHGCASG